MSKLENGLKLVEITVMSFLMGLGVVEWQFSKYSKKLGIKKIKKKLQQNVHFGFYSIQILSYTLYKIYQILLIFKTR